MSNIFHMFVGHVCLLWNNVNLDPMPIFKLGCLVFCFWNVWVLCIFWILTPYRINDMQISSHIGRFFCYVHSFLCCAEAFCFHIGEFIYLCFCSFAWGNLSRNILRLMSEHILPMFSSRSFMVSGHRFKFWIRFELIFFFMVQDSGLVSLFCAWRCPVFPIPFIERTILSPLYVLC